MSKNEPKKPNPREYPNGAANAARCFVENCGHLSPDVAMMVFVRYTQQLDLMVRGNDCTAPFVSRALATALEQAGIESYDDAFARIRKQEKVPT